MKTNRKKKVKVKSKAPVKKKKAAKKSAKPAPKAIKALKRSVKNTRASMVAKSLPNPVASSFVICAPETETAGKSYLADSDSESFTIDVTRAKLFETKEAAQGFIDGALVLATEDSPFNHVEIVAAKSVLKPHYVIELIEGEYMLSVRVFPKDADDAVSFQKAKALVAKELKDAAKLIAVKTKAFQKAWG